ncbi:MAG: hypothetical protein HYY06_13845 [Deltaproteobacteria bacterium]|nr:hypothetical protein [Deltaproteobacteria bacterium]
MKTLAITIGLAALLGSAVSFGQERRAPGRQEVTTYDENAFSDELVRGDLVRPDGDLLRSGLRPTHITLLRIRKNFVPEMLKSVERQ